MERLDFIKLFTWKSSSSHQSFSTNGLKINSLNFLIKVNIILAWIYKLDGRLRHVNLGCIMTMKGIRMCRPKRRHVGIRIILSWRQLRNSTHRGILRPSPFCQEAEYKFPLVKAASSPVSWTRKRRHALSLETESQHGDGSAQTNLAKVTFIFH